MKFNINIPDGANLLIHTLQDNGYSAYVVGGCVRDSILGREPHDWDICTSATPEQMLEVFKDKKVIEKVTSRISYGGGCINDTIIHLATSEMGFGGVGESGMGSYHGKTGFDAFSHTKSIVDKKTWMDLPMRYQPYNRGIYGKLLKMFLK